MKYLAIYRIRNSLFAVEIEQYSPHPGDIQKAIAAAELFYGDDDNQQGHFRKASISEVEYIGTARPCEDVAQ
jgi:hypothetical protein